MSNRRKWAFVLSAGLLAVVAVLVTLGLLLKVDWSTFVPDLIIGVIGASAIGLALFALQESSERRRIVEGDVAAAYSRLLDALTPLRVLDLRHGDAGLLSVANTRLVQLYETVVPDDPALGRWFEAERQLGLFRALQANERTRDLQADASADEVTEAAAPFLRWVADLTHNVRFWRSGQMTVAQMTTQAEKIEAAMRSAGAWRERAMPWREDQ